MTTRFRATAILWIIAVLYISVPASGALIYINVDSGGTGANTNIYGTVWNAANQTVTSWGSHFRDYQFRLQSATPVTLTDFYLQVSASLRQQTPIDGTGITGAAWFNGTIAANPSPTYASAIATSTLDTALLPIDRASFDTLLMSIGSFNPDPLITVLPQEFFIRVWANGANSNNGVQLKLVPNSDLTYNPDGSATTMQNYNGSTYVAAGTFTPVGPTPAPTPAPTPTPAPVVTPEPSQIASALLALTGGATYMLLKRRRRFELKAHPAKL